MSNESITITIMEGRKLTVSNDGMNVTLIIDCGDEGTRTGYLGTSQAEAVALALKNNAKEVRQKGR